MGGRTLVWGICLLRGGGSAQEVALARTLGDGISGLGASGGPGAGCFIGAASRARELSVGA